MAPPGCGKISREAVSKMQRRFLDKADPNATILLGNYREKETAKMDKKKTQKVDGGSEVLAAIAAMEEPYRGMAERLHRVIKVSAPALEPKTWYGMPGYTKDGKVVCFFRSPEKFKERYMTFGFNDKANLDDGAMWPVAFAIKDLTAAEEARISALVKKAAS